MLPFASLRARLIAAFAAVIALSVVLSSGAFAYLVREYQADREKDRLETIARSTAGQVFRMARAGTSQMELESQIEQMAQTNSVRILLISERGVVLRDTENNALAGQVMPLPAVPRPGARDMGFEGTIRTPGGEQVYAVAPFGPAGLLRVAVVAPEQTLTNAWRDLLPRLSLAALGALVVSVGLALWLASSITRPLAEITRASEEMARGNYDRQVHEPRTRDEVGRLAAAFNAMAREVSRSHRAMHDLLANVSHDLRTPLTSIQGFAGALLDGTLRGSEGAREAGRVIGEEAERMRRLVEDLLYLGRIESGEVALAREVVDLADLAGAAGLRFAFRADEAGISLRAESSDAVVVEGDPHRLAQVLDNLLDNAFKHTPPGGRVTLRAQREDDRGVLEVHNSGSVIAREDLERVFERFYQVDRSRASGNGHGLGLSIAREIVQAHGGTIQATSDHSSGTTFRVLLPVLESARGSNVLSERAVGREALTGGPAAQRV